MASAVQPDRALAVHPLQAMALAGAVPLFLAALLADLAYWSSAQVEWSNFAAWLLLGGLALGAIALACALAGWRRADRRGLACLLASLATWATGLFDALVHARDAWAVMPAAPVLSALAILLACAAAWLGFSPPRQAAR